MPSIERRQLAGMNIHYRYYSLDYFLDCQHELGFRTIELWGGAPHFYLDTMSYQDVGVVRKKIRERDLELCVFTPENCMYQYQFAAPEPLQYEKSYQYFEKALHVTAELGCGMMQCNSGWGYWNEDREEGWKRSRDMLERLTDKAAELGITLVFESLRPQETRLVVTLADTRRMFEEINRPNFKILIDTTAMSVSGETLEDWFRVFGDDIRHTHFIDSNPYGHLAWGQGNRNLADYIDTLNRYHYKGYLGQELTVGDYLFDPRSIDEANMAAFEPYFEKL